MGIEQLLEKASAYMKEPDLKRIREAYEFADQAHHGQVRKSENLIFCIRWRLQKLS